MRTIIITDTHFGVKQNSMIWAEAQTEFFINELIPYIKNLKKNSDEEICLIHCGDVFDSRSSINPYIAKKVQNVFSKISSICPLYIIAGNHDFYSPTEEETSSLEIVFGSIKNIFIVKNHIEKIVLGDKTGLLVPWYEFNKKEKLFEEIDKEKPDYIFCHTDFFRLDDDYKEKLKNIKVFSGHIHGPYRNNNFINLGSTFALTFADCNSKRGFYCLYENSNLEFITGKNTIKFWRYNNEEIFNIKEKPEKNDYVEIYIKKINLLNKKYTEKIKEICKDLHNYTIIPCSDQILYENKEGFKQYDIKEICKKMIPKELEKKFERISSKN